MINLSVLFLTVTTAESSRGIVVPSMSSYVETLGGSITTLSVVVSIFSVGRLLSSPFLGWLSGRVFSNSLLLTFCIVLCILGNLLYGTSLSIGLVSLICSRFLLGFATGILGIVRAFVSLVTTTEERTSFMSLLNAVQFIGFSLTPLLGSLLCQLDFRVFRVLNVNCFSAPGFFLALVNAVILVIFVLFFQEPPSSSKSYSCSGETKEKKQLLSGEEDDREELISSEGELRWAWLGPAIFISLNLVVRGCLAVLETIGGILFRQVWISGPTGEDSSSSGVDDTKITGYYFTFVGGVGLVTYFAMTQVSKRVSDFTLLVLGLFCLSLGSLLLIGIQDGSDFPRFLIGCICVWSLGMPLTATCVLSMCSKITTPTQQATVMGLITAAGSVGRILGPLVATLPETWCFVVVLLIVTSSLVVTLVFRKRMVPTTQ